MTIHFFHVLLTSSEQTRLVKNYIAEACTVKKSILGNRPCDVTMEPMQLEIPVLPCNFIPIQPQLYTGRNLVVQVSLYTLIIFLTLTEIITALVVSVYLNSILQVRMRHYIDYCHCILFCSLLSK